MRRYVDTIPLSWFPVAGGSEFLDFLGCAGAAIIARFDRPRLHYDRLRQFRADKHVQARSHQPEYMTGVGEHHHSVQVARATPIMLRVFGTFAMTAGAEPTLQLGNRSSFLTDFELCPIAQQPWNQKVKNAELQPAEDDGCTNTGLHTDKIFRAISTTFCGCSTRTLMASRRSSTP